MEETTPGKNRKWWREAAYLTAISAAIIVPCFTALDNWFKYRLEAVRQEHAISLESQKDSQTTRQQYLDRAIDPNRNTEYRRSVLGFLVDTLPGKDPMRAWAFKELKRIEAAIAAEAKVQVAQAEIQELRRQLSARSGHPKDNARLQVLKRLEGAEREIYSLERELETARRNANVAPAISAPPGVLSKPNKIPESLPSNLTPGNLEKPERSEVKEPSGESGKRPKEAYGKDSGGLCCITCQGRTICAASVSTSCGSCGGGGEGAQ